MQQNKTIKRTNITIFSKTRNSHLSSTLRHRFVKDKQKVPRRAKPTQKYPQIPPTSHFTPKTSQAIPRPEIAN